MFTEGSSVQLRNTRLPSSPRPPATSHSSPLPLPPPLLPRARTSLLIPLLPRYAHRGQQC
jgi:hypothetical protein